MELEKPLVQNENIRLEFKGSALEYFKVWIVNILLTIVTIGIYSPWAKVRNNQYLYANSYFGNYGFEYTANPVRILIGRVLVVGMYIAFIITGDYLGLIEVAMFIFFAFLLMIPWLFRQAIAFRLRYTSFQGINFKFHASTGEFYIFFLKHAFLFIITIGIIFPYTHNKFKELVINNTSYGETFFNYESQTGEFYIAYLIKNPIVMGVLFLIFFIIGAVVAFALGGADYFYMLDDTYQDTISEEQIYFLLGLFAVFVYFLTIAGTLVSKGLMDGWIGNIIYNNTNIDEHQMENSWSAFRLAWIYVSNFFVVVFTLGLMHPWAKVRVIRYKLENTGFVDFNFEKFKTDVNKDEQAFGEESADFFDIDVGF